MSLKSELEAAHGRCGSIAERIAEKVSQKDYVGSIELSVESLAWVLDSIRFQIRYLQTAEVCLPTLDHLIRFAPRFFQRSAIRFAEETFATTTAKRDKVTLVKIGLQLQTSKSVLDRCLSLWGRLSESLDCEVSIDDLTEPDVETLRLWQLAGLVYPIRPGIRVYAKTMGFNRSARGMCAVCGAPRLAPMVELCRPAVCEPCGTATESIVRNRHFLYSE